MMLMCAMLHEMNVRSISYCLMIKRFRCFMIYYDADGGDYGLTALCCFIFAFFINVAQGGGMAIISIFSLVS